ncbi:dCTP deaminase [Aeropyrum camini]|uniref:dCTP deaminase n=1 Tax=Aeropyrum camini SY1 = JCM 12091 TaxID=1198449 RepID=U3TBC1_9CREN|nr:dCTP deaminase [Aeropyrum camini]BAN89716.1 deoxycytidine triphosphate deaminase [Aeropyrum camini SY1 = JCM 12091]
MILSDRDIRGLLAIGDLVVNPLSGDTVRENGLDLRLGRGYCRFRSTGRVLDPRAPGEASDFYECSEADEIIVGPGEHMLLHTLEYIRLPSYVAGLVNLRSTWARTGIYIPATVVDAGFEGQLTIEVIGSGFPVKLYPGDRFLHLVLVKLQSPAENPYKGRYQGQRGVRLPKLFAENTG